MSINKIDFQKLKEIANMDMKDLIKILPEKKTKIKFKKKGKVPKEVVSLDIGEKYIKIVSGKFRKDNLIIDNCIESITPKNSIVDGKIANKYMLKKVIESILKSEGLTGKSAIITTNSSSIINREVIIPKVDESELETVIRYEIQKYLPINLNDYDIQYMFKDTVINDSGENIVLSVIAFQRNIVQEYYSFLEELNLKPYALDITYNSVRKINNYSIAENEQGTIAFIDMGGASTNVTILKNKKIDFTRIIRSAESTIDLLVNNDFSSNKLYIDDLLNDLQRVFKYYSNKNVGNKIETVFIYGGSSKIEGLQRYLENQLEIRVEKITNIDNVEFTQEKSKESIEDKLQIYLNAIGAIIRY